MPKLLANGKTALHPRAVKLLRRVIENIQEEPKRFNMSVFGAKLSPGHSIHDAYVHEGNGEHTVASCGTVGCIAGWAVLLGTPKRTLGFGPLEPLGDRVVSDARHQRFIALMAHASETARELLDITDGESQRLFFVSAWPEPFRTLYDKSKTNRTRVKIATKRIEHFIATRE